MSLLQVKELTAGYGKKTIINSASMELQEGQVVGVLGQNGCGKSTFIKALCKGISYQGKICISSKDIQDMSEKELARICSYVPQQSGLSIDISAIEVVLMGYYPYMSLLQRPNQRMKEKACELLARVGLKDEIDSNYMELSEGQKRMCILARSLVTDAKLLFMDEPDASLDFGIRNNVLQMIVEHVKANKAGAILALHDTDLALSYCDKIYLMKNGQFSDWIIPGEDSLPTMERKLQDLYGNVRLLEYLDDQNKRNIVMVRA